MPDSGIPRKIMLSIVEISGRALSMIMSEVVVKIMLNTVS